MKWDDYYLEVCKTIAKNSKCLSRKIGAILVKDKSIIATGYNGPPRGVPPCNERWQLDLKDLMSENLNKKDLDNRCPRYIIGYKSGQGLHLCDAGHAERNAIINAARHGVITKDAKIYMDCPVPCVPCLVEIINAGIKEIVCTTTDIYEERKSLAYMLIEQSGIIVRTYNGDRIKAE